MRRRFAYGSPNFTAFAAQMPRPWAIERSSRANTPPNLAPLRSARLAFPMHLPHLSRMTDPRDRILDRGLRGR